MLNISKGKVVRPQKVVIYGSEGVGKTTLAARFPDVLFIDTEGGTAQMDVRRIDSLGTWEELIATVKEVAMAPRICKTLVIDTADWAEALAITFLCRQYKKTGIEEFGYGKGYTYLGEEFGRLLSALDMVLAAGINVVVTAHAKMRKFEQPDEMGAYDRWEMKLTKQVAPILKEWCDMLLFCNYQTFVVQGASPMEKAKAQGGKRVMYATHHPCWDAKNRHGLPEMMDLDYQNIAHLFGQTQKAETDPAVPSPKDTLKQKLKESSITADQLQQVVAAKTGHPESVDRYPEEFITKQILPYWEKIAGMILNTDGGQVNE